MDKQLPNSDRRCSRCDAVAPTANFCPGCGLALASNTADGRRLPVAVCGVGLLGEQHAQAYLGYPRANLIGVYDRDVARAQVVAARLGVQAFATIQELADSDAALVSIATPDFAHREPAVALANAGKHLLVEKPLAMTSDDGAAMVAAASRAGRKLSVNLGSRFNPAFLNARDAIAAGEIGQTVAAHIRHGDAISVATKMLRWADKSGPHWFLFPHSLDLVQWLTGVGPATSVYAVETRGVLAARGIDCADTVRSVVQFPGLAVSLEVSWIIPDVWPHLIEFEMTFEGSEGRMRVDRVKAGFELSSDRAGRHMYGRPGMWDHFVVPDSYWGVLCGTVDALLDGGEPPVRGEDALHTTAIIEAMDRSIQSGVPEAPRVQTLA